MTGQGCNRYPSTGTIDSQALVDKVYDDVFYFVLRIAISLRATIQPVMVPATRSCVQLGLASFVYGLRLKSPPVQATLPFMIAGNGYTIVFSHSTFDVAQTSCTNTTATSAYIML
jgi:hypothetical protein